MEKKRVKKYIAALGEFTNHSHKFESITDKSFMDIWKDAEKVIIDFIGENELSHEEHKQILFPDGVRYQQFQMRELDPFENEIRDVRD